MPKEKTEELKAIQNDTLVIVASQSPLQWQPVELTPRLTQMNRIFASVKYKTPPSDKVTLGEGYLEVVINIPSDKDRFGVTEFGTFRFWFNEGRVEKLFELKGM